MHRCSRGPHSLGNISTYSDTALKLEARGKVSRLFNLHNRTCFPTVARPNRYLQLLEYAPEPPAETAKLGPNATRITSLPDRETKNCGKPEPDAALASAGSVFDFPKNFWPQLAALAKSARRPIDKSCQPVAFADRREQQQLNNGAWRRQLRGLAVLRRSAKESTVSQGLALLAQALMRL